MLNAADFPSLQSAITAAAGCRLVIPHGTYSTAGLVIPSHIDIDTDGPVIINTSSAAPVFDCSNAVDFRTGGMITLVGNAPAYTGFNTGPTSDLGQCGIKLANSDRYEIGKIEIRNMYGAGIQRSGSNAWQHQGRISGVRISNCFYGMHSLPGAEYETISDAMISNCVFGILEEAGNNTYANCKTMFCSIGVKLAASANNAHGIFTGLESNHNTYNLTCVGASLGETFSGCHFISDQSGSGHGIIQVLSGSTGINLIGCQIGSDLQVDGTSLLSMQGCYVRTDLANVPILTPANFIAKNNFTSAGMWAGNN